MDERKDPIRVPASNGAPLVTALGVTLLCAGLVTHVAVSLAGVVLFLAGAVAWFREVLPHELHESVPLEAPPAPIEPSARAVLHLAAGEARHRARLPVEIYPYTAGLKGGLAGGVAMAVLAVLYGVVAHGSPWYTVNLLAAAGSAQLSEAPAGTLALFSPEGLVLATLLHAILSVLVGLLYAALLPMFPWHPAFWGGIVAPLLWTGLIAASLHVLNPALNARIDWWWFVATQVAFGCVAGFVVDRSTPIATFQHASFAERAGLETQERE